MIKGETMALTALTQQRRTPLNYDLLLQEMRKAPYLADYLLREVVPTLGYPDYYVDKLPSSLKKAPNVNVLYPLSGGIYIHVYTPIGGRPSGYRKYVAIEPPKPPLELFELVEAKMAEYISEKDVVTDPEEKRKLLLNLLDKVVRVVDYRVDYKSLFKKLSSRKFIPVYREDYEKLRYYMIRDKVGLGVLEPFIRDAYIEDISCDGVGYIYIVHKVFGPLETNIGFKTQEDLDRFVIELSERIGKPVSHARPIVDATLPDGSRINIVFGTDVSLKGSNFTIRKFSKKPISVIQLIKWGTLDTRVAAYLWILLLEGMSGFISGETASGKTTSLNAIIAFIKPSAKIVTIEDTAEVQVPHDNWVRELTRDTGSVESSVTMFDLLKAALRQRPNYIIVGEIRGAEGNVAFQAMQSVGWETPVLIRDCRTGKASLVPIGEFVDSFYGDGEERVPKYVDGYEVLSMDPFGKVVWGRIKYVLRHRVKKAYLIRYGEDAKLIATGSHSVFVLDRKTLRIVPKPVSKLRRGDLLVSFVASEPPILGIERVSLGSAIQVLNCGYGTSLVKLLKLGSGGWAVTAEVWLARLKGLPSKIVRRGGRACVSVSRSPTKVPAEVLIKLMRKYGMDEDFPGLFRDLVELAEGNDGLIPADVAIEFIEVIKSRYLLDEEDAELLSRLELLATSDAEVLPVREVKVVDYDGYVYDLSVPGTELFIGGEVPIALHNTGHPVLATFHAGSVIRLIQRVTSPPINVPKTQLDNLNFVIIQSAVYREGVMLRRMLSVNEILGYDATSDSIIFIPVFTWDPSTDKFLFRGKGASYLLEEKIATMRGISRRDMKLIYDELNLRAQILQELVRQDITDYFVVFRIFAKIFLTLDEMLKAAGKEETQYVVVEGLEKILRKIKTKEFIKGISAE